MLAGNYNPLLVVLSILVAILASFTALNMAARISAERPRRSSLRWLVAGGIAMGAGIWSMHFIGMLAFRLPIALGYDLWLTLGSLLVAVLASLFALWLVSRTTLSHAALALGAVLMGLGIAWMHYIGMAALRMQPAIDYEPRWFAASIIIAIGASWTALHIAFRLRSLEHALPTRLIAAVVMGMAIVGMHYTGMAAARFPADAVCGAAISGGVPTEWLAAIVVLLTVGGMVTVLALSLLEQRMQGRLLELRNTMLSASLDDARRQLFHASQHDSLTRLPNRQLSHQRIQHLLDGGRRATVMALDLDGFRHINGAFGPQAGDAALLAVADRLRQLFGADDLVGRLGADQFVIARTVEDAQAADALAERIILAVNSVRVGPYESRLTASLGVALLPDHGDNATRLLNLAETAMRYAKRAGRNLHTAYADWMNDEAGQDQRLLQELSAAIGGPQLSLHYQPRVLAENGCISGAEASPRWLHPEHGAIPPERIICLAEAHGLMEVLGGWMLDQACRQLRSWHDAGHEDWKMLLSLAGRDLDSTQLLHDVERALHTHALPPSALVLELSETAAGNDRPGSAATLRAIAALGVGICIGDFGIGFSSLLRLRQHPATEIKINRAFLLALEDSDEDVVVVSAIVALAHALELQVVAEGIETPGQRAHAERLGCDHLLGYLLGGPVSAEQFTRLHASPAPSHAGLYGARPFTSGPTFE